MKQIRSFLKMAGMTAVFVFTSPHGHAAPWNQVVSTSQGLNFFALGQQMGSITPAGLALSNVINSVGYTNFDYKNIDPSTETGRQLVPEPTMDCYGTGGPHSPTAQCLMVRATTAGAAVVGASVGVVNEDFSNDTSKNQVVEALGGLQDSPNSALWGLNIVLTQGPGTAGIMGQEIDMNRGEGCDSWIDGWVNPGSCSGNTAVLATGLQLSNHAGSPAFMVAPAPTNTSPLFNVGYMITGNAVRDSAFVDQSTTTHAGLRIYNSHPYGVDCTNATFTGACLALKDSDASAGQAISWFNLQSVFANANAGITPTATIDTTLGQTNISNYATGIVNINGDSTKETDVVVGSGNTAKPSSLRFRSSGQANADVSMTATGGTTGETNTGTLTISATQINITGLLQLAVRTKAAILGTGSPQEGEMAFDSDDHEVLTYRCPSTSSCAWYPTQYGAAMSN